MESDSFILKVDSLSYGGRGVGRRSDGKVVFIPMVIPGETVRARVTRERKSYLEAVAEEIVEASPDRITPECEYFEVCGGCDWQHIAYPKQLEWKHRILLDEILRHKKHEIGNISEPEPSAKKFGYRGHARFQCRYENEMQVGFFKKNSKEIVPVDKCPVLNEKIQQTISELREMLNRDPVYGLYSIDIHAPDEDVIVLAKCRGSARKKDVDTINSIFNDLSISGLSFVMFGQPRRDFVLGQRYCRYDVRAGGGLSHLASGLGGFIQANMQVNDLMVDNVLNLVRGAENCLDLYCGCGNFSIPLARQAQKVVAIEKNSRLVSLGRQNAKHNRIKNVKFHDLDVKKAVMAIKNESVSFDTVILDPPREGAKDIAQVVSDLDCRKCVYISCNPTTLSRDLDTLVSGGFKVMDVKMFDMFPQTYHIESVTCLER